MLSRIFGSASVRRLSATAVARKDAIVYEGIQKELVSGAPADLSSRVVRIFREAKAATQSGHHNGTFWKLNWDVLEKGNRWENDLMGYQGTADALQGTSLKFDTREAAVRFAEKQGWSYIVQEPKVRHFRKKEYANNFVYSETKLKHIRTK